MKKSDNLTNARSLLAFFLFILAAGVFLLFYANNDMILMSNSFSLFMVLAIVCMGLLLYLMYLASNATIARKKKSSRK